MAARRAVEDIGSHLRCPLGLDTMLTPVVMEDGHSYDLSNLQDWYEFQMLHNLPLKSPITRAPLSLNPQITHNHALVGLGSKLEELDEMVEQLEVR